MEREKQPEAIEQFIEAFVALLDGRIAGTVTHGQALTVVTGAAIALRVHPDAQRLEALQIFGDVFTDRPGLRYRMYEVQRGKDLPEPPPPTAEPGVDAAPPEVAAP